MFVTQANFQCCLCECLFGFLWGPFFVGKCEDFNIAVNTALKRLILFSLGQLLQHPSVGSSWRWFLLPASVCSCQGHRRALGRLWAHAAPVPDPHIFRAAASWDRASVSSFCSAGGFLATSWHHLLTGKLHEGVWRERCDTHTWASSKMGEGLTLPPAGVAFPGCERGKAQWRLADLGSVAYSVAYSGTSSVLHLQLPQTPWQEQVSSLEVSTWARQSSAFSVTPHCHLMSSSRGLIPAPAGAVSKGPHACFQDQPTAVQMSEFPMFSGPLADIPQWFIWSSMRILVDV